MKDAFRTMFGVTERRCLVTEISFGASCGQIRVTHWGSVSTKKTAGTSPQKRTVPRSGAASTAVSKSPPEAAARPASAKVTANAKQKKSASKPDARDVTEVGSTATPIADAPAVEPPSSSLPTSPSMVASATIREIVSWLHPVIADGLPVKEKNAGSLLQLRSVYARAVVPSEMQSRLQALNELLPRLIASLHDDIFRGTAQLLFGLAPGTRATTLTARRRQAADLLGYSLDHFRSRKEAELVEAVAILISDDLLRYQSRVKRASESLEPTGDTPSIGPEHLTHEEELISRIWARVYGLRAELIAIARLSETEGLHAQIEDHRQAARREEEALTGLLKEYRDTYGAALIRHGETELAAEALARLVGWRG